MYHLEHMCKEKGVVLPDTAFPRGLSPSILEHGVTLEAGIYEMFWVYTCKPHHFASTVRAFILVFKNFQGHSSRIHVGEAVLHVSQVTH